MSDTTRNVVVLGSTGSIGRSTLEVIAASGGELHAVALSAHRSTDRLIEQVQATKPRWMVITDRQAAAKVDRSLIPSETKLLLGDEGIAEVVSAEDVDIVVSAVVGSAGLRGTWAALDAGKPVALANKESLVVGGALVTQLARERNVPLLPVDSEHSAVFQAIQSGRRNEVHRVILTASGGPFRGLSHEQLSKVTIKDALNHPTWAMGPKITVDSATLMNKALEIIEARWLFDLTPEEIGVVIHPQSVVHSMVEYKDGSVIAQLSPPDMRLPIQYALTWPMRTEGIASRLDWGATHLWEFFPPDLDRFPALRLGLETAGRGGSAGAVLNGANEAAVAAFLDGRLRFDQIVPTVMRVLEDHEYRPDPKDIHELLDYDRIAREEVGRCIARL